MSLRRRFLLSLLAVLLVVALPALYAVVSVTTLRDIVLELRGQAAQSALAVGRLDAALVDVDRYQRVFVATPDAAVAAQLDNATGSVSAAIQTLSAAGFGEAVGDAGIALQPLLDANARLEALVAEGRMEDATAYLLADATQRVARARTAVPALAAAIDVQTGARVSAAQQGAVTAATATTVAVLLGVVLAVVLALAGARALSSPLDRLRRAMARVAEGTFEAPADLSYDRADAVGELSRSFRTMTRRLTELDRLKAEFVGTVSHDLKTPVSLITGYADLMEEELGGLLDGRQEEILHSLCEQTRTLQRRVDQLLEMSRMESGRITLGLEEINLRHFADELQREYAPAARARDLLLELTVHEGTPASVIADPDVLRTDVIGNLLDNAIKFTPAGGIIHVSVRPDGQRISIEVADTGLGIPQDQLDRIFERYYRSRGTTAGAGLGLTIAKAGIENHGGRIEVQSRVGRGTRFRVTLPVGSLERLPTCAA